MTETPVQLLRRDLRAAEFTVGRLGELWGAHAAEALNRGQRVPALRALEARQRGELSPALTLARLFVLGVPVARADLAVALPALGVRGAIALGLAAFRSGPTAVENRDTEQADTEQADTEQSDADRMLDPLLDLRPYSFVDSSGVGSWWIVSDLGELALGHPLREDHVLGIGGASVTLSGLMIQSPVGTALDLGTGCGIQALHASRHAGRVVATDISTRALELARLNAELNDVENIEFRLGSLFEPVAGERFDQIVSNPPFVITPRAEGVPAYEYRDGGMVGDSLVQAVIRGVADHLKPGGIAQMLGNWEYHGSDAFDRVAGWIADAAAGELEALTREPDAPAGEPDAPAGEPDAPAGEPDAPAVPAEPGGIPAPGASPLDAWIVEREVQTVEEYAETWIRDGGTRAGTPEFDRLYSAWLDDFDERGVTQVGFGYLLLRRGTHEVREPFRRLERLHGPLGANEPGLGEHFASCLAAHDWQARLTDAELGARRLVAAPDVTEERHYWPGDDDPTAILLRQGSGFGRTIPIDTALAGFVGACDGELSVAAISAALASLLDVDPIALDAALLPRIRALVDDAMLLPVLQPDR